jgi:UDP-glucose 4-epimerase
MRALVTGATGFIGSFLVKKLIQEKYTVAVLIRPNSDTWRLKNTLSNMKVIPGELTTIEKANDQICIFEPELVFHLGWYGVGNIYRDNLEQVNQNLYGSIKLLEIAAHAGCRHWIGLGSQAEYGRYDKIINEDFQPHPNTLYGITKLSTCLLSQKLCNMYKINYSWLRLFSTYGPFDAPQWMIPYTILKLLKNEKPSLTFGEQRWDYLYVEDIADALFKVSTSREAIGIFNLGSGEAFPIRSIVENMRNLINPYLPIGFGEIPYAPDQIMHLQSDISRLKRATGWFPKINMQEGLIRTIDWFKENLHLYVM